MQSIESKKNDITGKWRNIKIFVQKYAENNLRSIIDYQIQFLERCKMSLKTHQSTMMLREEFPSYYLMNTLNYLKDIKGNFNLMLSYN